MERTCCPSYTIRLKAADFAPSKEQVRVFRKMQRYLDGKENMNKVGLLKDQQNSPKTSLNLNGDASSSTKVPEIATESSAGICENMHPENEVIDYLSNLINEAIAAYVRSGEFPSTVQLPRAVVKKVTFRAKRKLMEISEGLLYTSNISFQIAAFLRRSSSSQETASPISSPNPRGEPLDISPALVAEKLAGFIEQNLEDRGLIIKACNGHINFYSYTKRVGSFDSTTDKSMRSSNEDPAERKHSFAARDGEVLPSKRRKLEIRMKRSSFDLEEFALYRRYQIKVHDDKPEKVTESSYRRFLVDSPLVFVPPHSNHRAVPSCGFGSFHQQYVIDGKLVAVGVVDVLPKCLSSKYLFWDPDLAFLSLGKYSALQEINWVKEAEARCPSLQYYYLGYYIHSCSKMRYKAAYHPSELLCPLRYVWVPFKNAKPLLDKTAYAILSDHMMLNNQESSAQMPSMAIGRSDSPNGDAQGKHFSDEGVETDFDVEGSDSCVDNESDSESSCELHTDDLEPFDISNILMDVNGSRFKFKRTSLGTMVTQLRYDVGGSNCPNQGDHV
ncbi:uncharacterized protein A4U43_C02F60 [Asparagus officinalis]|uniref:Arginyl-tRNA--protein transferase n=1 Tax=Asparagus officinalis TaxID=4686 RepID=A0A5P1FIT1_ASPOF|nr:uncharacterized protein A4U43_C02F60 [Asparagus officinalis]